MGRYRYKPAAKLVAAPALLLLLAAEVPARPESAPNVIEIGRAFTGYSSSFAALALSPDGRLALTGDEDKNVVVWDVARGVPLRVLRGHRAGVFSVAFSSDGTKALSGGLDGALRLWRVADGALLREIDGGKAPIFVARFSPDQRFALAGDQAGALKLWDLASGRLALERRDHRAMVVAALFTNDGRRAITTDMDNHVIVWDTASWRAIRTLERRGHFIMGSFLSPDQRAFVFAGPRLELRTLASGDVLREFPQPMSLDSADAAIAFSPDGGTFIVESDRHVLHLWETATGRLTRAYQAPLTMRAVSFTPDGKGLLAAFSSTGKPGVVVFWPTEPGPSEQGRMPRAPSAPARAPPDSPDAVALGKLLFFDRRLSGDGLVSCATCHDPAKGWSDGRAVSAGIGGRKGRRNALSLLNVGRKTRLFWDGRASSLEEQTDFPISNPDEMGSSPERAASKVAAVAGYKPYFHRAFGDEAATPERIARALSAFERTLVSNDTPYDRFVAGDAAALSPGARRGLDLFRAKARCFACHDLPSSGPITPEFINVGLDTDDVKGDRGRYEVTRRDEDLRAFIVPDLRNVGYTAPYMHDGRFRTLREVVDFYDKGGGSDPRKALWLAPLGLTEGEKKDLVDFLSSLDGDPLAMAPPAPLPR